MELKEEDLVMCTVKSIEGTAVFVHIEGNGEGNIVMSEVAAGRIRNLREYVAPNKKIVCKVLKIDSNNIQLSLRRVSSKEKKEVEERYRSEKTFATILAAATKNAESILNEIKKEYSLSDFISAIKEKPSLLEKFCDKNETQAIAKMLMERKEKDKEVKKIIILKSISDRGVNDIKETLSLKNVDIKYLGSSHFSVASTSPDAKEAKHLVDTALQEIEKRAKEKKLVFEIKEK